MTAVGFSLATLAHAARTPGAALLRVDDRAWSLSLGETLVRVPYDRPDGALDALADALDALHAALPPGGDAHTPVALLWATYDACWHAASPRPVVDRRPAGDRCPSVWMALTSPPSPLSVRPSLRSGSAGEGEQEAIGGGARGRSGSSLLPSCSPSPAEPERSEGRTERGLGGEVRDAGGPFTSATDRPAHAAMIASVRASIRDGDVYLVNVARMLHRPPVAPEEVAARVLRADAPRALIVHTGDVRVAAMSMELGLSWDRRAGVAVSRPIKGTRPRRADPADDAREAAALAADEKERAENAMAVDVHRNDLGRVARVGGVSVPVLCGVEAHRYVHHLVSTVRAEVDPALSARAMLAAMLPVGSVTGAPKLAAMETIAALEAERRGLYTGVYGAVFADGRVELTVAIRTLVTDPTGDHYGVGGGIVWDSDAGREWEEMLWKQRGVE